MNIVLWILQILLALLFLFAGITKLVLPIEAMTANMKVPLPGLFLRFIGVCETLGGLGLVLPWLLKIKPKLTPLAAACLAILMLGAVGITVAAGDILQSIPPLITGLLCAFVAYGRSR